MNQVEYGQLENCCNEDKPYLYMYGIQDNFTDLMPVHLTHGRMPKNSNEILLPEHLLTNGGIKYQLQDTFTLALGLRTSGMEDSLNNRVPISRDSDSNTIVESLTQTKNHTYTVTGFYERPSFENYSSPSYTALTVSDMPTDGITHDSNCSGECIQYHLHQC
ncbi:MAG: hypothetical protein RSF88_11720 [Lachnospiraceae bacterium]